MTYERKREGNYGEDLAAEFLRKSGYKILARNYKTKIGEIDILCEPPPLPLRKWKWACLIEKIRCRPPTVVIVEVKTKSGSGFGAGFEMVNYFKRKKLINLAKSLQVKYPKSVIRIDVISIDTSSEPPDIRHFENAVEENI